MKNVVEFLRFVNEKQGVRNEIEKKESVFRLKSEQTKASYKIFLEKEIIPIAKKYGFLFTADDYVNFINDNSKKILSEDQLEEVAGGRGGFFLPLAMAAVYFFQGSIPQSTAYAMEPSAYTQSSEQHTEQDDSSQELQEIERAIKNDDVDTLRNLLEEKNFYNIKFEGGQTPLHIAARNSADKVINFLYQEKGVYLQVEDDQGKKAIDVAKGKTKELLLNVQNIDDLFIAICNDDVKTIEGLIEKGVDVNARKEWSALYHAALNGSLKAFSLLISKGAVVDDSNPDIQEMKKLMENNLVSAVLDNNLGEVEKLLADENTNFGELGVAFEKSVFRNAGTNIINILVPQMDNETKSKALSFACYNNKNEIAKVIIDSGVDQETKIEALDAALCMGNEEIAKIIIDSGVDQEAKNKALAMAVNGLNKNVVTFLIERGANVYVKHKEGKTALELASENGNKDMVNLLIEKGGVLKSDSFLKSMPQKGDKDFDQYTSLEDPEIQCKESVKNQIKAVVDDLIQNVDKKTPPEGLSEDEIQKGIASHKFSKHYKLSRNLRITKAIYSWIVRNVEYTEKLKSLDNEEHFTYLNRCLEDAFVNREGVCLGKSLLFKLMTRMAGIPCESLGGDKHAFNAMYVEKSNGEKGWTIIDPTWGRFDIGDNQYTEDLDNLFDNFLEELKSLYSEESSFKFNEGQEKKYFSRLKPLVEMKKQEYDKSKETQTITAEDIRDINNEYEAKGGCVVVKRILIVGKDGNCKIRVNFDFQKDKLLRKPTKLIRQENFPAFYSKKAKLLDNNSTMVEGGKHPHKIEHIGNMFFEYTEQGDLKIHCNDKYKTNLRVTEGMVGAGKKIIIDHGIKKLELHGDAEIDISASVSLGEIDVSNSTRYGIKDGKLYDITDQNNLKEVPHKWGVQVIKDQESVYVGSTYSDVTNLSQDNSTRLEGVENFHKIEYIGNTRFEYTEQGDLEIRCFGDSGTDLCVTEGMVEAGKKIIIGYGIKKLEIHGDAEIDISGAFDLEEIDISNSTRYGFANGILYEKSSKEVIGAVSKEISLEKVDNDSIRILPKGFGSLDKLVVTQEMSNLNKKIIFDYGIKSLELHGNAEIDISDSASIDEVDISNSTRYDIKDGKLYDITDLNIFKEVPHRWPIQVIKNQEMFTINPQ